MSAQPSTSIQSPPSGGVVVVVSSPGGARQLFGTTNPVREIENMIAFTSRDMSEHKFEAWLYGIVLGWDPDPEDMLDEGACNAMGELAQRHGWSNQAIERLRMLHANWERLSKLHARLEESEAKIARVRAYLDREQIDDPGIENDIVAILEGRA